MPTIRQIRRQIRSVQSTAKITHAMEMIAASKMRRAQQMVLSTRPYAEEMRYVLGNLAAQPRPHPDEPIHPLLASREVQRVMVLHFTADRGLCGGLNGNMNRLTAGYILQSPLPVSLVTVGRRGRDFMLRYGRDVIADFIRLGDRPTLMDTTAITRVMMDAFLSGEVDEALLAYPEFVNTAVQRPVMRRLLPIMPPPEVAALGSVEYIYEPDPETVLVRLLPSYLEMQVYHAVLETIASEQSARMVAMRNATDNAKEMITDLTLSYNKARQDVITKELLDLVGGAAALA